MKSPMRRTIAAASAATLLSSLLPGVAGAQAKPLTRLKLVLNWRYQGPQSWFFIAQDKGYFKAEGLDVEIDQGEGSAASIIKVANGSYDVGFGDMNALIDLASKKPAEAPIAVYMMFNVPPFTIAVRRDSPIRTPKDLEGRTIGGPANDGALKLFPAFAKAAKIDPAKVKISNMAPNLREQMLRSGQVDAVFGFINTIAFSAKAIGIDPDKDLRFINYGDHGLDLYSNTIVVSQQLAKNNPAAVRGLLRAINRGLVDTLANLDAAVDSVMKREPLLKRDIERERLVATLRDEMSSPELAKIGMGDVSDQRLQRNIDIVAEANELTRKPTRDEVFTRAFLPARADRPVSMAAK